MKALRLAAAFLFLFAAILTPSQAIIFFCDDICDCSGPCGLSCYSSPGVRTTCGQFGVCATAPGCAGGAPAAAVSTQTCSVEP